MSSDQGQLMFGVITEHCYNSFIKQGNYNDVECIKAVLAKFVGYGIILASFAIKAPQIFKILANKSVVGLSPLSFYVETVVFCINATYHIMRGSPLSAYGELLVILVQDVLLVLLLWAYMTPREQPSLATRTLILAGFAATCVVCAALPAEARGWLPLTNIPLSIIMRYPQIQTNARNGHTGQLAGMTVFMNLAGTCVRVLTSIQEVGWDWRLLGQYGLSATLNGITFLQIIMYHSATKKLASGKKKEA